MIKIYL